MSNMDPRQASLHKVLDNLVALEFAISGSTVPDQPEMAKRIRDIFDSYKQVSDSCETMEDIQVPMELIQVLDNPTKNHPDYYKLKEFERALQKSEAMKQKTTHFENLIPDIDQENL